jgi:hypothetical protein
MSPKRTPAKAGPPTDPGKPGRIEKRKVTMQSAVMLSDGNAGTIVATDYVPVDILDDYVADAQTRWQQVTVDTSKHDPGPAGDDGPTHRPKLK